jgi:carbamoyltransferase
MKILGISTAHDASVAVIKNNKILYFCKQERLSKIKRDYLHINKLESLNEAIKIHKDIDVVVLSSPVPGNQVVDFLEAYLKNKVKKSCKFFKMCDEHHKTHASLAFYNSGFKKSLVFVIDRHGSKIKNLTESESVFICDYPNSFTPIYKSYYLSNIGENYDIENLEQIRQLKIKYKNCKIVADSTMNITKVYETATTLIGQNILENGKTMGLSSYGKDEPFEKLFIKNRPNTNLFFHYLGKEAGIKKYIYNQNKNFLKEDKLYSNYAFQVQKQTQEEILTLIKKYVNKTKIDKVCLTGGYALNVLTNQFLIKNLPKIKFYFEPLADDSGNSIGAAYYYYRHFSKNKKIFPLDNVFFNHKKEIFKKEKNNFNFIKITTKQIAKFLQEQKIVAVYNKLAEAGPRSLGNRSILFDPRNINAKDIINKIKKREWYRPFACSILEKSAKNYFYMYNLKKSPFMTISFDVKSNKKKNILGVVHVNNTCRIQTVNKKINHLYKLLLEFEKLTKVPALLNTSFNIAGKPLVETIEDAINTFKKTNIDVLWLPEYNLCLKK